MVWCLLLIWGDLGHYCFKYCFYSFPPSPSSILLHVCYTLYGFPWFLDVLHPSSPFLFLSFLFAFPFWKFQSFFPQLCLVCCWVYQRHCPSLLVFGLKRFFWSFLRIFVLIIFFSYCMLSTFSTKALSFSVLIIPARLAYMTFCSVLYFGWGAQHMACGILVPWPGIGPAPLQWSRGVLTIGPPGKCPCKWLVVMLVQSFQATFCLSMLCNLSERQTWYTGKRKCEEQIFRNAVELSRGRECCAVLRGLSLGELWPSPVLLCFFPSSGGAGWLAWSGLVCSSFLMRKVRGAGVGDSLPPGRLGSGETPAG